MSRQTPQVQAAETTFRIIEAIKENRGAGVSDLAREVDLSKSAVHKHLQTLTDLGYLVREGDGYYLSNRFLSLGTHARERLPIENARGVVERLAETTGHVSNFIAHENDRGVFALRIHPDGVNPSGIIEGDLAPLHATAGGKAILAFVDESARLEIIESAGLPPHTEKTITDRRELERELSSVRDQRVAFDREEYMENHQCVASPVLDQKGDPVGAVSVTGKIHHMSGKRLEEDVTGLVTSAAKSIENEILSN